MGYVLISLFFQQSHRFFQVFLFNRDIKIGVQPRLFAKQPINAPAAVNPNSDPGFFQVDIKFDYVSGRHFLMHAAIISQ